MIGSSSLLSSLIAAVRRTALLLECNLTHARTHSTSRTPRAIHTTHTRARADTRHTSARRDDTATECTRNRSIEANEHASPTHARHARCEHGITRTNLARVSFALESDRAAESSSSTTTIMTMTVTIARLRR